MEKPEHTTIYRLQYFLTHLKQIRLAPLYILQGHFFGIIVDI